MATNQQGNGFITVRGRQLVTAQGEPFVLRGMGIGNWLLPEGYMFGFRRANSPRLINEVICQLVGPDRAAAFWSEYLEQYFTPADVRFIKRSGLNHIRIPFNYRLFVTEGNPLKLEGVGYALLERAIDWCRQEGLYVILDMHGAPGGQTGDNIDDSWGYPFLYESPASQELTVQIWAALARRYAGDPTVIGYDLLNEPIATHFDAAHLNPLLEPLYRRIVAGIREHDPNHIVFLGGAQWNTRFDMFGPPFDDRSAYTFHRYWTEVKQEMIQPYLDFSEAHHVPLWMGESGENTDEWIASFRTLLEENGIGWTFWTYKRLDTERCMASIPKPADWDSVVTFAEGPRGTYQEVRENRPPFEVAARALDAFLNNLRFENCRVNQSYLQKALGLGQP